MVLRREPTARQRRLGLELRRLREAAGLTATEAAALLGANRVQITHIESGLTGVSEQRLRRLKSHYACTDEDLIAALAFMATDRTRGWWDEYRGLLPTPFLDLSELEHHATFLHDVAILYVPGRLQTADYARAVFSSRMPSLTEEEIDLRVQHRMTRQEFAVPHDVVIHEAALRIRVGDRKVARDQLEKLLERSEADHVTLRVVPFDVDGFGKASSTMTYAGGPLPRLDTVVRDAPHGVVFMDAEAQLDTYRTNFRMVTAASLEPARSRTFIHELAREL
ncbi:helix-turn-helix domain-containing protein [Streptomyces sp. NPDC018026]|uniref:helix-turn-helix domain-containing protein n=1 Tax=Streptomyces sp. NPDC018026 TaxID=3365031 RepID=UPI0037A6F800